MAQEGRSSSKFRASCLTMVTTLGRENRRGFCPGKSLNLDSGKAQDSVSQPTVSDSLWQGVGVDLSDVVCDSV
jgi:hypothetical protein